MPKPKKNIKKNRTKKIIKKASKKNTNKKSPSKKIVKKQFFEKENNDTPEQVESKYNLKCIKLINCIKKEKTVESANQAFEELLRMLLPKVQKVVSRFNIPGYDHSDILQEALYALRYKAIKDYDRERGTGEGPALFDKFALLCIRRHLATEFKSSFQNKKRVLNQSLSIDKENNRNSNNSNNEEDVVLSNIIADKDNENICELVGDNEYYRDLQLSLLNSLSSFEKEVYILYAQKYSYEEIAEKINGKRSKITINIKGVDNALSRIKQKGREILDKYEHGK